MLEREFTRPTKVGSHLKKYVEGLERPYSKEFLYLRTIRVTTDRGRLEDLMLVINTMIEQSNLVGNKFKNMISKFGLSSQFTRPTKGQPTCSYLQN
jgi:hypothetical protein